MSDNTLKFDKGKNAVLVENNAQTIFDHLNELEKDSKTYSKRWFWELLQNAKDSVDSNSKVSVKVILYENSLSFLHTGDAFEESDILHLIFHGSSKKSLEGKTGRFGTGFMSTHLLSRKVNITGKLSDNTYFKFDLNREANRILEQQENLESSYTRFCSSNTEKNYSDSKYNTIFTYDLAEPSFKIAVSGIEQLQQIMPFVMAFNEKIENIEVVNNKTITIIRGLKKELIFKEKKIINQEILYNDIFYNVVFIKSDDSDVAVLLEKKEGVISLVNLDEGYPKLFFDFPLFGTERFGCPVIINSKKFDLKGERDGIYLGVDNKDKPTIVENKRIISNSLSSINILIEFLFENFPIKLYNLYKLKSPFEYNWLDNEWLESIYTITIQSLLNTPCVKLNGKALPLNSIALPFSKSIEAKLFYNLVTDFKKESTPDFEDVTEWISVAVGFSNIEKKDITDYKSIIDERELCILIENNKSLDEINNIFISESSCEKSDMSLAINWLNDLFNLFSKEQTELLSSLYCIIPNQKKQLTKREVNALFFDQIGNEEIKSVAESFDWDIKSELIYEGIKIKDGIFQVWTLDKTLTKVSNLSDIISDEQLVDSNKRQALINNLKWLINNKKSSLIKESFVVVEKGRDSSEINYSKRRLFQSNSDKLIAPSTVWFENFSIYKEIVLKKFILIDEYTKYLTFEDFKYLELDDVIFLSPLILRKKPSKNDLKLLINNIESYPKLLNENDEVIDNDIEFSDIAYLTRSDDNILSKTADSVKSAKSLLRFLLSQILTKDDCFNEITTIAVNGEVVILNKCLWVARLRETQWIPLKIIDGEKQSNSERPSVSNITELIKDEPEIFSIIKTRNAALFFNKLGISVADLIRNTLTNEEDKLKWDITFSELLTNKNINPELASEMLSDSGLQDIYLKRKQEREQIKANQDLGYLFERIFREIFESEEFKGQGFKIERTAIGSDFGVIYEEDVVDENNKEIIYKVGKVLIELKASGKKYAEMTTTQAEEATKHMENYVLAVLPLNYYEINKESVKEHSRFVINIASPLLERYNDLTSYSSKKRETTQEKSDVRLNIEDGDIRYQVKSEIWENSSALNFNEFINWLKTKK